MFKKNNFFSVGLDLLTIPTDISMLEDENKKIIQENENLILQKNTISERIEISKTKQNCLENRYNELIVLIKKDCDTFGVLEWKDYYEQISNNINDKKNTIDDMYILIKEFETLTDKIVVNTEKQNTNNEKIIQLKEKLNRKKDQMQSKLK